MARGEAAVSTGDPFCSLHGFHRCSCRERWARVVPQMEAWANELVARHLQTLRGISRDPSQAAAPSGTAAHVGKDNGSPETPRRPIPQRHREGE